MATKVKTIPTKPGAWVVNSKDRGRKSIKNGKVYLYDKEEFQIELYNPLQKCVLADIKLNGSSISKAGLVLNPGQRFYLDCFIEDNKKFIFNTYEVENTDEVKEAITKNGLLEVNFYEESINTLSTWILRDYNRRYYPWNPCFDIGTGGDFYCSTNTFASDTSYCNEVFDSNILVGSSMKNISNIETGRVDKGEKSKQKFETVDMDFTSYSIASVIVHLLPESRKPIEIKDIKKIKVELPKQNYTKEQIEALKNIVGDFVWEYDTDDNRLKLNNAISEELKTIEILTKLGELHKAGLLTDEEFSVKKTELLSKI